MLTLHRCPVVHQERRVVSTLFCQTDLSTMKMIMNQHSSSVLLFLTDRWLTGCWYAESSHSPPKISAACKHPLLPPPPLLFTPPCSLTQPGPPSSPHLALYLAPFLTPPAEESLSMFRTRRISQTELSTVSCLC